ncbi:SDR family NAD(P)-dependent oxidoreductase [Novosphingobium aerophilum]|uniref:SDR family NAD(P)-dependent oxidoreductase n=1 Tax=Novosphingobium TaxID=165696 RepID=UPI0006C89799|nr:MULTISPECIES: SDR family NAD(P)-dependent oxidoreductase [unclassified Novosphingobium]KPH67896.1 short-chain dehydrogenase [Novosphingobium sp. ST904]MPS68335.1 SDR family NAD(P)-dependent oxidoreductase [Novosphingobium sp.]TCM35340.1 NAD(P)-dependent dehydrogenase (short-subunit alcohol dehydrogenase family) [Novosphingobium sp. ST904]WRT95619.1 SDR family NAD(P)-dependent oxidoreductase [Novosphingobium sp. RL4]
MSAPLSGKVALVTGASRGIGKGIALVLAEQGATVYVTGRTVREGDYYLPGTVGGTAAECDERGRASGGSGVAVACDHGNDAAVAALFEQIEREQGRLDILVNNAFTLSDDLLEPKGFWEKPLSNLEMWDVGVRSNYVAAWHAARIMAPQGSGLIVAISGFAAVTYTYGVIFGTSKSAVDRMARDMAIELEPHGVASLTLWQGLTLTEKARDNLARMGDRMTTSITSMQGSSVEHPGRVVAALAADPQIMKRSGGEFVTAELAQEYGIADVDGSVIASARASRGSPVWKPISEVDYRGK